MNQISKLWNSKDKRDKNSLFNIMDKFCITKEAFTNVMKHYKSDIDVYVKLRKEFYKEKNNCVDNYENEDKTYIINRAKKRTNEIKKLLKQIPYNKDMYLDIGSINNIMPNMIKDKLKMKYFTYVNIREYDDPSVTIYNGTDLPFKKNSISVITIFMVLHHITDKNLIKLIKSIKKVLKPDGLLIIREHDLQYPSLKHIIDIWHFMYEFVSHPKENWKYAEEHISNYKKFNQWNRLFKDFKIVNKHPYYKNMLKPYYVVYKRKLFN